MKKTLLFLGVLAANFSFSQKLMNSEVQINYDEFGNIDYADSTVFLYSTFQGHFDEFKPVFGYDGDIMYFHVQDFIVHCNKELNYQGFSYPLSLVGIDSNIITNDLVTQTDNSGGSFRLLYTYNTQGDMSSRVNQFFNGTDWISNDSIIYEYDLLGNKVVEAEYSVSGPITLQEVDSLFYESGSIRLTESTSYGFNGTSIVPGYQTLINWNGNNVNQLDILEGDGSGALDFAFRLNYNYTGSQVTGFDAFEAVNGVPNPNVFAVGTFTFNAQNDPETYKLVADGFLEDSVVYSYDSDGFLTEVLSHYEDGNGDLYLAELRKFDFTSIASVTEVETLDVVVYPNPVSDILRINSPETINLVEIVNMNGQVVLRQNNSDEVNVVRLPKGTYVIYGQSGNKQFKSTFVKN